MNEYGLGQQHALLMLTVHRLLPGAFASVLNHMVIHSVICLLSIIMLGLKGTSADVLSGERLELLDGGLLLVPNLGPEGVALDLCSGQRQISQSYSRSQAALMSGASRMRIEPSTPCCCLGLSWPGLWVAYLSAR